MSYWSGLGYLAALLFAQKQIEKSMDDAQQEAEAVDEGVRQQLEPSTESKIPVLYGNGFFGGDLIDAAISSDLKTMHYVLALSEATGTKLSDTNPSDYIFGGLYLNNNRVYFKVDGYTVDYTVDTGGNQDISMRDLVKVYFYDNNGPLQPSGSLGTTPAAHTLIPHWDNIDYDMDNLIYAVIEVTYNQAKGVTELPDALFYVENSMTLPGDVLYDYMNNATYGGDIAVGDIDDSILVDLNTYCTAGFSYTDSLAVGQSGPINFNGLIDTSTECLRNMTEIAKAGGSWLSYDIHEGKWTVIINDIIRVAPTALVTGQSYTILEVGTTNWVAAGAASNTVGLTFTATGTTTGTGIAYDDVVVTDINDSHIVGDIGVTGTELTQLNNIVDVKYQNTDILDKTDFVKIGIPPGELKPNEPQTTMQMSLPFTNKQSVAMKLGLASLRQARVDKIITFRTDYSFINLKAGEVVSVTNSWLDLNAKPFRIMSLSEVEGDDGSIQIEFIALEWDVSVYIYDITELSIETDDGISALGAIGQPDIPVVTNNQVGNIPHILIDGKVPSGIVDTMEYWITYDTAVPADEDRDYIKIGQESNSNGQPFVENTHVIFQYSNLTSGDFFVKVRGTNTRNAGPFSDPTGLVVYVPEVVADQITPDTDWVGLATAFGVFSLITNMDEIYDFVTGEQGIVEALQNIFFPGSGLPTGASIADELLANTDFLDDISLYASGATPQVPVTFEELNDTSVSGANAGNTIVYNGSQWVPTTPCCPLDLVDETVARPLMIKTTCPYAVQEGLRDPDLDNYAAVTGPCCIYYDAIYSKIYSDIKVGAGDVKLYKSDGTLVETIAAGSCDIYKNVISMPFATRDHGTDYYILMDEGIATYNDFRTPGIDNPHTWSFTTSLSIRGVCGCVGTTIPLPQDVLDRVAADTFISITEPTVIVEGSEVTCQNYNGYITISFLYDMKIGPGGPGPVATIRDNLTDAVIYTFTPSQLAIWPHGALSHQHAYLPAFYMPHNNEYYLAVDEGFIKTRGAPVSSAQLVGPEFAQDDGLVTAAETQRSAKTDTSAIVKGEYVFASPLVDYVYPIADDFTRADDDIDISFAGPIADPSEPTKKLRVFDDTDTEIYAEPASAATITISNAGGDGMIIESSVPVNGAAAVQAFDNITITFNTKFFRGTGNFYLYSKVGPTLIQTFDVATMFNPDKTHEIVNYSHGTREITLNPTVNMDWAFEYYITADAGCLISGCGHVWGGISNDTTLAFTIDAGAVLTPITTTTADDGVVSLDLPDGYEPGTGQLRLYDSNDTLIETIEPDDDIVEILNEGDY